ncbi:MAG: site-specific integrase [Bacteroidia bacterium]
MNKVHLRKAKLKNGMTSLYLDFYPPLTRPDTLKQTRREFLKMHVHTNPKTEDEKHYNKETLALADAIRSQRQIDLQNGFYGFISTKGKAITVIEYFMEQVQRHGDKNDNWVSAAHHVKRFFGSINVKLSELTVGHCNRYKEFLLNAPSVKSPRVIIHSNSALSYFNKFKTMLKQAYRDGLLKDDINSKIDRIKETDTVKEYLSLEELKLLSITPCKSEPLKRAALFSALTGIRFCDIVKMVWGDIRHSELTGYVVHFRQSKTKGVVVLPISNEAFALLGEIGEDDKRVFVGLRYSADISDYIRRWLTDARIFKHITFHCFRHTYATIQISLGTDIYTVSKMLGHKSISTTQIYAKLVDRKKNEAANKISLL